MQASIELWFSAIVWGGTIATAGTYFIDLGLKKYAASHTRIRHSSPPQQQD